MSSCDPRREQVTVWTFTEDELFHRWGIHQRYDLLNRYAAAFNKDSDKPAAPKLDNSDPMLAFLESAIQEQGEDDDQG